MHTAYGFVDLNRLLIIIAVTQAICQWENFRKMCKKCVHCKINDNILFDSGLCLKPHKWLTTSTQEKEFWFYSSNKVNLVNLIVIHSAVPFGNAKIVFGHYFTLNLKIQNKLCLHVLGAPNINKQMPSQLASAKSWISIYTVVVDLNTFEVC